MAVADENGRAPHSKRKKIAETIWAALALGGSLILLTLFVSSLDGCKKEKVAGDAAVLSPDVGGKNCDAVPNEWRVQKPGAAATIDDAGTNTNLFAAWGASETEIYAVGSEGRVMFYDGTAWKRQPTPTTVTLTSVWGASVDDVWASGFGGTVIHYVNGKWVDASPPPTIFVTTDGGIPTGDGAVDPRRNLWGIWVASKNVAGKRVTDVVYAVGDRGTVLRMAPPVWTMVPAGVEEKLTGVWGTNANKVYIVGDFGTVLVGGTTLTKQQTGVDKALRGVWGHGDNDVYAVGLAGTVLHSTGGAWKKIDGAPKQFLRGVWGPKNRRSEVYIIGWDGTLFRLKGGPSFSNGGEFVSFNCVTPARLEGIWGTLIEVPRAIPDAGLAPGVDIGVKQVPRILITGVSGTLITGP